MRRVLELSQIFRMVFNIQQISNLIVITTLLSSAVQLKANHPFTPPNNSNRFGSIQERIVEARCKYVIANTNKVYEETVSHDAPLAYVFFVERKYIQSSHVSERDNSQQTTNLRLEVGAGYNASLSYPVMFAVRQQKIISTLEVPSEIGAGGHGKTATKRSNKRNVVFHAGRTLCLTSADSWNDRSGRNVTVRVSTHSRTPVRFYITLKLTLDFQIPLGQQMTVEVSPTSSKYYGFSFARPDLTQVKIRATSQTADCMTISVQPCQCPVYDLEHNVKYQGLWQTMSTRAAMTVQKMGWYSGGFVLVFVAHIDTDACRVKNSIYNISSPNINTTRTRPTWGWGSSYQKSPDPPGKIVKLLITDESKVADWIIFLCLLIPIAATLLTAFAVLCLFRNRHEWMVRIIKEKFSNMPASQYLIDSPNRSSSADRTSQHAAVAEMLLDEIMADTMSSLRRGRRARAPVDNNGSSSKGDKVKREENPKEGSFHWKSDMYIADFSCKEYHEVKKFSKRFYWTILIVAIFYSIPVYQLVLHYLRVLYRTGEYDICYYNYLCAQRLGLLIDFNHFWSNASYVIFGILYIFIVRRRSRNLCVPQQEQRKQGGVVGSRYQMQDDTGNTDDGGCCCCCSSGNSHGKAFRICFCSFSRICFRWDHGVPAHFGVFYALGVALTMEGFLSAAYHLCPNQSTFQFDTCFMYVIAVLLLLKMYQFRHPVHFGANQTFAILAGFVFVSVLGLLFEQGTDLAILIFKCIFLPIQYVIMIVLSIYYYAIGYIRDDAGAPITDWSIFRNLGQLKSQRINGDRLILPLISFFICVAVLFYSELSKIGFASYLLYILVGNVLGTTLYYVGIMKPLHGEFKNRTWVQPVIYFVAAGIIGGFSMQYFVRAPAQWELSASASRAENEDCLTGWFPFHPFYDSHDAWHFLSAASLFLAFMGLLIVDDDLITTPQHQIPIF